MRLLQIYFLTLLCSSEIYLLSQYFVLPSVLKTQLFVGLPSCASCTVNYYISINGITYLFAGRYGYCRVKQYWRGCCHWWWWRWCMGSASVSKPSEVHISSLLWQSWGSPHIRLISMHSYCAANMSNYKQLWTIFHYKSLFYKFVVGAVPPFIGLK
jgi:hypothetical protein